MIERCGEVLVPISSLVCGDGFEARLERPHVRALADSIKRLGGEHPVNGVIHHPVVRASDNKVGAGEDRIAAMCLLDQDNMLVSLVECSDEELEAMREAENKFRRNVVPAELLAMVESRAEELEADEFDIDDHCGPEESTRRIDSAKNMLAQPGRPMSPRGEAIREVAAEVGRSPDAVRKSAERAAKRAKAESFETWGTTQPKHWTERVSKLKRELENTADKLRAAMAALTRAEMVEKLPAEMWQLHEQLKLAASRCKLQSPACVCAYCKNMTDRPEVGGACEACGGRGYLTAEQEALVPAELRVHALEMHVQAPEERFAPFDPEDFPVPDPDPDEAAIEALAPDFDPLEGLDL